MATVVNVSRKEMQEVLIREKYRMYSGSSPVAQVSTDLRGVRLFFEELEVLAPVPEDTHTNCKNVFLDAVSQHLAADNKRVAAGEAATGDIVQWENFPEFKTFFGLSDSELEPLKKIAIALADLMMRSFASQQTDSTYMPLAARIVVAPRKDDPARAAEKRLEFVVNACANRLGDWQDVPSAGEVLLQLDWRRHRAKVYAALLAGVSEAFHREEEEYRKKDPRHSRDFNYIEKNKPIAEIVRTLWNKAPMPALMASIMQAQVRPRGELFGAVISKGLNQFKQELETLADPGEKPDEESKKALDKRIARILGIETAWTALDILGVYRSAVSPSDEELAKVVEQSVKDALASSNFRTAYALASYNPVRQLEEKQFKDAILYSRKKILEANQTPNELLWRLEKLAKDIDFVSSQFQGFSYGPKEHLVEMLEYVAYSKSNVALQHVCSLAKDWDISNGRKAKDLVKEAGLADPLLQAFMRAEKAAQQITLGIALRYMLLETYREGRKSLGI